MKKIDLHVHSKYSEHPSEWFLQRLGAAESYTEPDLIFNLAKQNGMDFVTITDHNRIEGSFLLKQKYPNEVITGIETTAYFPEDGCKVHILLFGINEKQYDTLQKLREDIYQLRDWIKSEKIAYSVSHPLYSVNGKLNLTHLEKLILLFDVFEGLNAGRASIHNEVWVDVLRNIDKNIIEQLYDKYKIEPFGEDSHIKAFTGGSDDHAGIFVGKGYTLVDANNAEGVLEKIRDKKISFAGKHNDFKSLAFTVYKVAYDFSRSKNGKVNPLMESIFESILRRKKSISFVNKVKIWHAKRKDRIAGFILTLIENLKKKNEKDKLEIFYEDITNISDTFIKELFESFEKNLKHADFLNLIKNTISSFAGIFLSVPFFSAFKHLHQDRDLLDTFRKKFKNNLTSDKKILWFTDTINDLNGVSITLSKIALEAYHKNKNLKIVTSLDEDDCSKFLPNLINLKHIYKFRLPYYEQYVLKIPSILKTLQQLQDFIPDEIYVSTPGPVGLIGLLMSKIFSVRCIGIFHTDFKRQAEKIVEDETLVTLLDNFVKWFYNSCDIIEVPSAEYINILKNEGFEENKLRLFKRGIDLDTFAFKPEGKKFIEEKFGIKEGLNLLYVGRISKDKNIDFILDVYKELIKSNSLINLIMVGDGPYLEELKNKYRSLNNIVFTGKIENKFLPYVYSASHIFLFPSTTDTFGMAVLEAQACGLPAIVSDKGGPKNIIIDGKTGFISEANNLSNWLEKTNVLLNMIQNNPSMYLQFREASRKNVEENYNLEEAIEKIFSY
ncbi:MAG: glycosyltransferase [Endomicrobiia bacterium]